MADGRITNEQIADFVTALTADYAVYGPRDQADAIVIDRIDSADELKLDYRNSTISPKALFLPRAEVVYEFDGEGFTNDAPSDEKRVIFGIRPCDCRAITLLDQIFDGEDVKDPFYVTRRQNTVIVALACNEPVSSCFCTAVGGDPFGEEGADVLLRQAGDSLSARGITPKGKDFLAKYKKYFSAGDSDNWDKQAKEARGRIQSMSLADDTTSCLKDRFEEDIWRTVSLKCLGCGACSYLCPTCYCFDLTNEKTAAGTKKVRSWDCCMFPLFTKHVSGHNPRDMNSARLRQKIMHKFSYYPERHGVNGCVGCGRCVRCCPVNLDIRQLLEKVVAVPVSQAKN